MAITHRGIGLGMEEMFDMATPLWYASPPPRRYPLSPPGAVWGAGKRGSDTFSDLRGL